MTPEQITDPNLWLVIDRLMQWLIIPALALAWHLSKRVDTQEREILRILTILEERNRRRDEDRETSTAAFRDLYNAIEKLTAKLDALALERRQ